MEYTKNKDVESILRLKGDYIKSKKIKFESILYTENKNIQWATQSFTFPPSAQSNLKNVEIVDIDLEGGLDLNQIDLN